MPWWKKCSKYQWMNFVHPKTLIYFWMCFSLFISCKQTEVRAWAIDRCSLNFLLFCVTTLELHLFPGNQIFWNPRRFMRHRKPCVSNFTGIIWYWRHGCIPSHFKLLFSSERWSTHLMSSSKCWMPGIPWGHVPRALSRTWKKRNRGNISSLFSTSVTSFPLGSRYKFYFFVFDYKVWRLSFNDFFCLVTDLFSGFSL